MFKISAFVFTTHYTVLQCHGTETPRYETSFWRKLKTN